MECRNNFFLKLPFWKRVKFLISNRLPLRLTLKFRGEGTIYLDEYKLEIMD